MLILTGRSYDVLARLYGVIVVIIRDVQSAACHIEKFKARHTAAHVYPVGIRGTEGSVHHKFYSRTQFKIHNI